MARGPERTRVIFGKRVWLRLSLGLAGLAIFCDVTMAWAEAIPPKTLSVVLADNVGPARRMTDGTGAAQGYLRELWELWGRRNGVSVTFLNVELAEGLQALRDGRVDVMGALPANLAAPGIWPSAHELTTVSYHAFSRLDLHEIRNASDLMLLAVGVVENTGCAGWLRTLGHRNLHFYSSYPALLNAAEKGEVGVFCTGRSNVPAILRQRDMDVDFRVSPPLHYGGIHWATRTKDSELHRFIADGFANIPPHDLQQVSSQWLEAPKSDGASALAVQVLTYFLLAALGAVVGFAAWGVVLRRRVGMRNRQLRVSERRFTALLDSLPEQAWVKDLDGRFLAVNASMARQCGEDDPARMVGRSGYDYFPREVADVYRRNDTLVVQRNAPLLVIEPHVGADGSKRWIESSKAPFIDDHGRCIGTVGISRELMSPRQVHSALGQATDALHACEARLRTLVDALSGGVFEVDRDGSIIFANERAWAIFGLSAEGRFEGPWMNLIHPGDIPAVVVGWRAMQAKGEPLELVVRLAGNAGSATWVHLRAVSSPDTEGAAISVTDVSEARLLRERLWRRGDAKPGSIDDGGTGNATD